MARILDLNNVQQSFMDLTLQDDAHTVVHLDITTEENVNKLLSIGPDLEKLKSGNREGVDMCYDLAAQIISCNLDYFTVTGKELREKYRMNLYTLIAFFSAYLGFINELSNQKN
jgi:hypothetical protein